MKKYDFIRFGGCVQWVNDSEGTNWTMQVCTPPHIPLMIIQKLLSFYQMLMTLLMKHVNHTLLMQAN